MAMNDNNIKAVDSDLLNRPITPASPLERERVQGHAATYAAKQENPVEVLSEILQQLGLD